MILCKTNKLLYYIVCKINRQVSTFSEVIKINDDNFRKQVIANFKSAPKIRMNSDQPKSTAAVLIPLCTHNNELSLLYTLRSSKLKKHTRQVSFPGGIRDDTDADYIACALRETEEEIGIDRKHITIWGTGNVIIPKFGPAITPVVGHIRSLRLDDVPMRINHDEVEKVFTVPIERLIDQKYRGHTQFRAGNIQAKGYSVPVFLGGEEKVWGMTGIITHLFLLSLLAKRDYSREIKYVKSYR